MGIRIVEENGFVGVKGSTAGTKVGLFFGFLLLLFSFAVSLGGEFIAGTVMSFLGFIIVSLSIHHNNKMRQKKLRESGYTGDSIVKTGAGRRIIGIAILTIIFIIVWNYVLWPILNSCNDEKLRLLDQAMLALDKGDSATADELQLKVDSMRC